VFTLSERLHDEREVYEAEKECIELVKPGENPPEGFQATKQPFHLVGVGFNRRSSRRPTRASWAYPGERAMVKAAHGPGTPWPKTIRSPDGFPASVCFSG